jgi:hypothetical protein
MVRASILALQGLLESLRSDDLDYVIVAVGVRGPNADCRNGNAVATVRMGHDEETYEALYLPDAIHMARQRIIQKRAAALRAKASPASPQPMADDRQSHGDLPSATGALVSDQAPSGLAPLGFDHTIAKDLK